MKFNIPTVPKVTMKYSIGKSKVLSVRVPYSLLKRLNKDAKEKNRTTTEIIQLVLDQYLTSQD